MKKCSLCGKSAIYNTILKCRKCGHYFCSYHEAEQFIVHKTSFLEFARITFTSFNYPNRKSFDHTKFICYKCRTGKKPNKIPLKPIWAPYIPKIIKIELIIIAILAIIWLILLLFF